MHPVLIKFGALTIHSYGFMLALSFIIGLLLAAYRAKQKGLDPNIISDVGLWLILSSIIGSRLYYVILHPEEFKDNWINIFNPFQNGTIGIGGLVMIGGFLGAVLAGIIFFKIKKLPFTPYADAVAPSIAIGTFLTRIGCFLNGCCYGNSTTSHWGVHFDPTSPAGYFQLSSHADKLLPSQLFESIGGLIIALIILCLGNYKFFNGFLFYLTCFLYALLRFFVDFSRFYGQGEHIFTFSHNQILCIGLLLVFGALIVLGFLQKKQKPLANSSNPVATHENS